MSVFFHVCMVSCYHCCLGQSVAGFGYRGRLLDSCKNCFNHSFIKSSPVQWIFWQFWKPLFQSKIESRTFHFQTQSAHKCWQCISCWNPVSPFVSSKFVKLLSFQLFCYRKIIIHLSAMTGCWKTWIMDSVGPWNSNQATYCQLKPLQNDNSFSVYLKIALNHHCLSDHQTTINFHGQTRRGGNQILTYLVRGFISFHCWQDHKEAIQQV